MKPVFTLLIFIFSLTGIRAYADMPFAAPTTHAINVTASSNDGDRIILGWTNGNGARRIIIARKDAPVTAVPVNGIDYNANASFGSGFEIKPGEFVVFNNTTSTATVNSLQAATRYYFAIFE